MLSFWKKQYEQAAASKGSGEGDVEEGAGQQQQQQDGDLPSRSPGSKSSSRKSHPSLKNSCSPQSDNMSRNRHSASSSSPNLHYTRLSLETHTSSSLSRSQSHEDMERILSPFSEDDGDNHNHRYSMRSRPTYCTSSEFSNDPSQLRSSDNSTDDDISRIRSYLSSGDYYSSCDDDDMDDNSIIRRVEEEIAAARQQQQQAAAAAKNRSIDRNNNNNNSSSKSTTRKNHNSKEDEKKTPDYHVLPSPTTSSLDEQCFEKAMDVIGQEFDDDDQGSGSLEHGFSTNTADKQQQQQQQQQQESTKKKKGTDPGGEFEPSFDLSDSRRPVSSSRVQHQSLEVEEAATNAEEPSQQQQQQSPSSEASSWEELNGATSATTAGKKVVISVTSPKGLETSYEVFGDEEPSPTTSKAGQPATAKNSNTADVSVSNATKEPAGAANDKGLRVDTTPPPVEQNGFAPIGTEETKKEADELEKAKHEQEAQQQQQLSQPAMQAADRARAILDTLKERREHFSTAFRSTTPVRDEGAFPMTAAAAANTSPRVLDELAFVVAPERPETASAAATPKRKGDAAYYFTPERKDESAKTANSDNSSSENVDQASGDSVDSKSKAMDGNDVDQTVEGSNKDDEPLKAQEPTSNENPSSPRRAMRGSHGGRSRRSDRRATRLDDAYARKSRRIRFRDPFPVLKPANRPREAAEIIESYSLGTPKLDTKWIAPKSDLRQLIVASMGASLQRRSNACGALKVLTREKKNQMALVRTDSFLEALVFAATQDISLTDKDLAIDARTRAIACLQNVCVPKDNRTIIVTHPGTIECLIKVIKEDRGEARVLACGALVLLAKAPECREHLVSSEGLLDILGKVLKGTIDDSVTETEETTIEEHGGEVTIDETFVSEMSQTVTEDDMSHSTAEYHSTAEEASHASHTSHETNLSDHEDEHDDESEHSDDSSASTEFSSSSEESLLESSQSKKERAPKGPAQPDSIRKKNEEMQGEYSERARTNACAVLMHLSRHCAVSHLLCSNSCLMDSLLAVSKESDNAIHTKCLEILCNMTRFPANTSFMTRYEGLVEALVESADSELKEDRIAALRAIQNMSADSSSKSLLANETVLSSLTTCALRKDVEEKEAAVALLYNVSTEPGAVVSITNTKNVVATLVHIAHHPESSSNIRLMACDALATISLWLQTLAGTGKVPCDVANVPLPSQKTTGWERWD